MRVLARKAAATLRSEEFAAITAGGPTALELTQALATL
jgi:hypothetical protein